MLNNTAEIRSTHANFFPQQHCRNPLHPSPRRKETLASFAAVHLPPSDSLGSPSLPNERASISSNHSSRKQVLPSVRSTRKFSFPFAFWSFAISFLRTQELPEASRLMYMNLALIRQTGIWRISPFPTRNKRLRITSSIQCAIHFRTCIDIHKGKVKQIVGSTLQDAAVKDTLITNFESDKSPAEFANLYKQDGLRGGHVIMLDGDEASKSAATEALHAYPGGMQVGGGINSENALHYLEEGASHVIVTSHVFRDGRVVLERLKQLVRIVGKKMLVLDLSCRKKYREISMLL